MIENKNDASRNLEKALQALEQAKQRVANEKKKQNEKKRKAENHHKYIMGGIIVKYFPDCDCYDEGGLNRILSVALPSVGAEPMSTGHRAPCGGHCLSCDSQKGKRQFPFASCACHPLVNFAFR